VRQDFRVAFWPYSRAKCVVIRIKSGRLHVIFRIPTPFISIVLRCELCPSGHTFRAFLTSSACIEAHPAGNLCIQSRPKQSHIGLGDYGNAGMLLAPFYAALNEHHC
jgi:hypothetical protein